MFLSSCFSCVPDHLVSAWSFWLVFKGGAGDWGLKKLEFGTGWFEACAFLLVVILFLSSCFPNNMVPFFLYGELGFKG